MDRDEILKKAQAGRRLEWTSGSSRYWGCPLAIGADPDGTAAVSLLCQLYGW